MQNWYFLKQHIDRCYCDIEIDTNTKVIVASLTNWKTRHSQREEPEGEARGLWWAAQVVHGATMITKWRCEFLLYYGDNN